jgi:hypothetical protein
MNSEDFEHIDDPIIIKRSNKNFPIEIETSPQKNKPLDLYRRFVSSKTSLMKEFEKFKKKNVKKEENFI